MRAYLCPQVSTVYVIRLADGTLWMVPPEQNGWALRAAFRGHEASLEEVQLPEGLLALMRLPA